MCLGGLHFCTTLNILIYLFQFRREFFKFVTLNFFPNLIENNRIRYLILSSGTNRIYFRLCKIEASRKNVYGIIKTTDTINMQISTARLIFILVVNFFFLFSSRKILYGWIYSYILFISKRKIINNFSFSNEQTFSRNLKFT